MITQNMITLIKFFENLCLKSYYCPAGIKTIGYGHVLKNNENFEEIDIETAENLLIADIKIVLKGINSLISVPLKQNQLEALTSFTFNLGIKALERSTLRQKINRGEHNAASKEFLKWVYCKGKKLNGLVKRRIIESELYIIN